jgi:hypothetical protein
VPLAEIDGEEFLDFTVRRPSVRAARRRARDRVARDAPVVRRVRRARELIVAIGIEPHLRWRAYCDLVRAARRAPAREARRAARRLRRRRRLLAAGRRDRLRERDGRLEAIGVAPSRYEGPTGSSACSASAARRGRAVLSLWAGCRTTSARRRIRADRSRSCRSSRPTCRSRSTRRRCASEAAAFEQQDLGARVERSRLTEYVRLLKKREFAQ